MEAVTSVVLMITAGFQEVWDFIRKRCMEDYHVEPFQLELQERGILDGKQTARAPILNGKSGFTA